MLRNRLYFHVKPYLPQRLRLGVRRWFAQRKRKHVRDVWPILSGSERRPEGWTGWPDGKQFAFVLTHDVESQRGIDHVKLLAELESSLDFRSSFNFIPEGPYAVSSALRSWLTANGFEVGVHDLHHDGKLFCSREEFRCRAKRINDYLNDWHAAGFRSGFMLNQPDWLHDLHVQYDASTFDTDPFEPQPGGAGTIFPFWVTSPEVKEGRGKQEAESSSLDRSGSRLSRFTAASSELGAPCSTHLARGYVELPYTVPQDSTLFLLLGETTPEVWLRKIDWIAQHGGMVLMNVHPDYMTFQLRPKGPNEYPVAYYRAVLEYVRNKYEKLFWHALPRRAAACFKTLGAAAPSSN